MLENTDNEINKDNRKSNNKDHIWLKSVRLTLNLIIHVLIFLTVFICLIFSFISVVTLYQWHIILCVLGSWFHSKSGSYSWVLCSVRVCVQFQFFMCQGILVMSPYNSWSMFMPRRYKKHIHWVMQVIAVILVTVGTVFIILDRPTHFTTIHGILGLVAFVCCLASLLNGILAMYPHKLSSCISVFWIRFFHYITGIASIFLATGSLCAAYDYEFFRIWTGHGDVYVPTLIFLSWLFTILVSLDFLIVTGNKIRNMF